MKYFQKDHRLGYLEWPAYLLDLYRIFPRLLFLAATFASWKIVIWYMLSLQTSERTAEVTAFVGIVIGAYTKGMDYYMQRGVDWSKRMQINGGEGGNTTTTTTTSTV